MLDYDITGRKAVLWVVLLATSVKAEQILSNVKKSLCGKRKYVVAVSFIINYGNRKEMQVK